MADEKNTKKGTGKRPSQKAELRKDGHFEGDAPNDPDQQADEKR